MMLALHAAAAAAAAHMRRASFNLLVFQFQREKYLVEILHQTCVPEKNVPNKTKQHTHTHCSDT